MSDTRECPLCDGEIKAAATRCRHCKEDIPCAAAEGGGEEVEAKAEAEAEAEPTKVEPIEAEVIEMPPPRQEPEADTDLGIGGLFGLLGDAKRELDGFLAQVDPTGEKREKFIKDADEILSTPRSRARAEARRRAKEASGE